MTFREETYLQEKEFYDKHHQRFECYTCGAIYHCRICWEEIDWC